MGSCEDESSNIEVQGHQTKEIMHPLLLPQDQQDNLEVTHMPPVCFHRFLKLI